MIDTSYVIAFKTGIERGPFKKHDKCIFNINNNQLFIDAFYQAYLDAARTFRGIGNSETKSQVFEAYALKVQCYFKNQDKNFDEWHEEWCDGFIKDLTVYPTKYGQAQKILNMMLKYLYCCDGAEKFESIYKCAHMPLDTFTLNWFKREVLKGSYHKNQCGYEIKEWSNLDKATYIYIKDKIKNHLGANASPLATEFIIWPDETLITLTNALTEFAKGYLKCGYPIHENDTLSEEIIKAEHSLKSLKASFRKTTPV